jgi:hypothetical protein
MQIKETRIFLDNTWIWRLKFGLWVQNESYSILFINFFTQKLMQKTIPEFNSANFFFSQLIKNNEWNFLSKVECDNFQKIQN